MNAIRSEAARERRRAEQIDEMPGNPFDPDMSSDSRPTWGYVNRLEEELRNLSWGSGSNRRSSLGQTLTLISQTRRRTKSLDASGGSVFRN